MERFRAQSTRVRREHVGMAIRAVVRLSWNFYAAGVSCYKAEKAVVR